MNDAFEHDEQHDVEEARALRNIARHDLEIARAEQPAIGRMFSWLRQRRVDNHFGEEIEITFTPRSRPARPLPRGNHG